MPARHLERAPLCVPKTHCRCAARGGQVLHSAASQALLGPLLDRAHGCLPSTHPTAVSDRAANPDLHEHCTAAPTVHLWS
jgi:hypothetical protein